MGSVIGRRVIGGRYRLDAPLDRGSMGSVYRGTRLADGVSVAIKILHARFATGSRHAARFRREAEVTARLDHPHIVRLLDSSEGTKSEPPMLVMEFLEGESLRRRIKRRGRLDLDELVPIARQVLSALASVHALGIAHRDLKPANVMLVPNGDGTDHVKVIDFGLARLMEPTDADVTQKGFVLGTPTYMAPEQALGAPLDPRADVYAVGAILYHAFSGQRPYRGDLPTIIHALVRGQRPRLSEVSPDAGSDLVEIVETAMSHRPGGRFVSATALDGALASLDPRDVPTIIDWRPPVPFDTLRRELGYAPIDVSIDIAVDTPPARRTPPEPGPRLTPPTRSIDARATGRPRPSRSHRSAAALAATLGLVAGFSMATTAMWLVQAPAEMVPPPPPAATFHPLPQAVPPPVALTEAEVTAPYVAVDPPSMSPSSTSRKPTAHQRSRFQLRH